MVGRTPVDVEYRSELVSTASKSEPRSFWRACRSSSFQRGSGAPVTYHGESLSASSIP
jgi:hypothetical protein